MWRGDYREAMRSATLQTAPEEEEEILPPGLAGPPDEMEPWVRRYWQTTDFVVGDRTYAAFNHALGLYKSKDERWEDALKALQYAYNTTCDEQGNVRPQYKRLASCIKTMAGNAAFKSHPDPDEKKQKRKLDDAIASYEDAIRLDPHNAEARFENERRKNASGGGGGKDGKEPKKENGGGSSAREKI